MNSDSTKYNKPIIFVKRRWWSMSFDEREKRIWNKKQSITFERISRFSKKTLNDTLPAVDILLLKKFITYSLLLLKPQLKLRYVFDVFDKNQVFDCFTHYQAFCLVSFRYSWSSAHLPFSMGREYGRQVWYFIQFFLRHCHVSIAATIIMVVIGFFEFIFEFFFL